MIKIKKMVIKNKIFISFFEIYQNLREPLVNQRIKHR